MMVVMVVVAKMTAKRQMIMGMMQGKTILLALRRVSQLARKSMPLGLLKETPLTLAKRLPKQHSQKVPKVLRQ